MNTLSFITNKGGDRTPKHTTFTPSSLFPDRDRAVVSNAITANQLGRIHYQETYWFGCALNDVSIPEGTIVEVLQRRGNTWLVKPITRK